MAKPAKPTKKTELTSTEDFIKVSVSGLTIDPFTNMPIIILKDLEEKMALPIWIGLIEASSIATELEKIQLARPMTHDLVKNILNELEVKVEKVEINDLADNPFIPPLCSPVRARIFQWILALPMPSQWHSAPMLPFMSIAK